jgi:DEAD/DEAH box helicase domain-containing protein
MAETSRDTAADMLQTILAQRDHLQRVDTLRQVPCNGLFDSELEARFIEALRRVRQDGVTVTLSKVLTANGRPGYRLQLPERIWYIELQVKLGSGDGVAVPSRADFVFRPAREQDDILPVVVFTDGYLYHRHRIGEDMAQRMAIAQSGRYHVWSLSWKDVEHRFKPQGGYFQDFLKPNEARGQQQFGQLLAHYDAETLRGLLRADSLEWFIAFLRQPDRGLWRRFAFVQGLMHLDHQRFSEPAQQALWFEELQGSLPGALAQQIEDLPQPRLYGRCDPAGGRVRLFAASAQDAIRTGDAHGMGAVCCLADEPVDGEAKGFEPVWNGFLRLYNLFQFLPNAFFVTQQGRARHVYDGLQPRKPEKPSIGSFERSENWTEIYELADPQWHGLIDKLVSAHWPLAEVGFELASGQGEVIATAELAWEDLRIAFLPDEDEHSDTAFREAGWQTAALSEILSKPEDYVSLHNLPQGRKPLDRENLQ